MHRITGHGAVVAITHTARRGLHRLCSKQYKYGQKHVFHIYIIHFQAICWYTPYIAESPYDSRYGFNGSLLWQVFHEKPDLVSPHHRPYLRMSQAFIQQGLG